jgi:monoterpene epsilon-lactone hydrolase
MPRSSHFILRLLKMVRAKDFVQRLFLNPPRGTGSLDPRKVKRPLQPQAWSVDGFRLLTIPGDTPSPKHVIFLPGGAYLLEATPFHRQFAEKLARNFGLSVTVIDYPKSPEHTFRATHYLLQKAYLQLRDRYPECEFRLLGDSAGGGLALAFLQVLRDQQITPFPNKTALISPWLDLSLSHPEIPAYLSQDLVLTLEGLQGAAALYAGGEDLHHPLLSPLYGDLNGLGEIKLVFGTEEIFYPDCLALIEKIEHARGTEVDWEVGEKQIHAWPIFPFPGSRAALGRIAEFLLGE